MGDIESNECFGVYRFHHSIYQIPDATSQILHWCNPPTKVLVIIKIFDDHIREPFCELLTWLLKEGKMTVYLEPRVTKEVYVQSMMKLNLHEYNDQLHSLPSGNDIVGDIDLIICLGGDGTLLHASSLFQKSVPPIMAFHFGSVGFLTSFDFSNFTKEVHQVLQGNVEMTLRSRLKCTVRNRQITVSKGVTTNNYTDTCEHNSDDNIFEESRMVSSTQNTILALNEVVVERGTSSFITNLDLYIDRKMVTSVQGDGVIVATPTGSTAYSLAAGASIVHPSVPCIIITPICPHSLSFRPIIVPAGVNIEIMLAPEARNSAWISVDGRFRQEILTGDSLTITTSSYPVPQIRKKDRIDEWFDSLGECLHWNIRKPQKLLSTSSGFNSNSPGSATPAEDS